MYTKLLKFSFFSAELDFSSFVSLVPETPLWAVSSNVGAEGCGGCCAPETDYCCSCVPCPSAVACSVAWPGALGLALACAHSFVMTVSFSDTLNCILKEEKY